MKFPLEAHPFRAVELTPEQCQDYERVSATLLSETIAEYERFVALENRTLNKKQWKAVKTRENLTVYKQTDRATSVRSVPPPTTPVAIVASNMHEWKLPKLLAVGSIVGTLDDVMYGVVAPDVKSMLLRSSYVSDELVDGGVLVRIKSPTEQDPFHFLGIKWLVKAHPTGLNAVVSPRDSVMIDGTGLHTQANGDRIGYHVMQSVLLPECPELTDISILRGHISSCYLFKQMPNGTVEVYMKTYVNPGGRLSESLAIMSVANALIGCYKSVLCAQGKKLAWLIKSNAIQRVKKNKRKGGQSEAAAALANAEKAHSCELCHTAFRAYKSARGCQSCIRLICSRCQITRKISHMQRGLQVKVASVVVCKDCSTQAAQLNGLEVARDEFVGKQAPQRSLMTDTNISGDSDSWDMSGKSAVVDLGDFGSLGVTPRFEEQTPKAYETMAPEFDQYHSPYNSNSIARTVSIDRDVALYSPATSVAYPQSTPTAAVANVSIHGDEHRQQLWMQMNQLRLAAEQTYQITKQNSTAMRFES